MIKSTAIITGFSRNFIDSDFSMGFCRFIMQKASMKAFFVFSVTSDCFFKFSPSKNPTNALKLSVDTSIFKIYNNDTTSVARNQFESGDLVKKTIFVI